MRLSRDPAGDSTPSGVLRQEHVLCVAGVPVFGPHVGIGGGAVREFLAHALA